MAPVSRSQLGASWVVHDSDQDDNISWEHEAGRESSTSDQEEPIQKPSKTTQSRRSVKMTSPKTASRSSAREEPQFYMPMIDKEPSRPSEKQFRKRQPTTQSASRVSSSSQRSAVGTSSRPLGQRSQDSTSSSLADHAGNVATPIASWLFDVLGSALVVLKKPISLMIALYLLGGIVMLMQTLLTSSIYAALSPVCRIPGVSFLHLPICEYSRASTDAPRITSGAPSTPVEFDELVKTQAHFEELLSESVTSISLPMDMKRSESSIRDLRLIVQHSQLQSRNELGLEFDGFVATAGQASYKLQRFNAHIGRGVDIVLSTARWTERVLADMALKQSSRGIIPAFIQDKILAPFKPVQFTEARLLEHYIQHTHIITGQIEELLDEAQALLLLLQNLEDRLDIIHGIAIRDNIAAQASKDEVLLQLWSALGGNRAEINKYNKQLSLLKQVGKYRKQAWSHVAETIIKLQDMGAELEELRTRVGSAEVLQDHKEIPFSVHIETIRMGVERLEASRVNARLIEDNHIRRFTDGTDDRTKLLTPE